MLNVSYICTELCGGKCCNPWWGIISYKIKKDKGLSHLKDFKRELIKGLTERAQRIINQYTTRTGSPQPLFTFPERYSLSLESIQVSGTTLFLQVRAMFAFRCRFFTEDGTCSIHPALKDDKDIRPEYCADLGSPEARRGERGFCRILYTARTFPGKDEAIKKAIQDEKEISNYHYRQGFPSPEEAVNTFIERLQEYCIRNIPSLLPRGGEVKIGRNDPCYCGSGMKYKKCHGR